MKIFTAEQIRRLDQYTIENEPVPSIELMERAARTFFNWFRKIFHDRHRPVYLFAGPGNNGGDGLAVARMLSRDLYVVKVFLLRIGERLSQDCNDNYKNLKKYRYCTVEEIAEGAAFPVLTPNSIVIDAIFGSGLNRPPEGYWEKLIAYLNELPVTRVSIDIPSGMFADRPTVGTSILSQYTFSFEMPKLAFFFSENAHRVGQWDFGSIGLHRRFIENEPTTWYYLDRDTAKNLLHQRKKYDHKGTFGHALIVAGSFGKIGAAVLAARACLRSGAGLLTVHVPKCGYEILQIAFPEAMVSVDEHQFAITKVHEDLSIFRAVGIGCGIGRNELTLKGLKELLKKAKIPLVIDADALNLLAEHPELLHLMPRNSLLTPHPGEFRRLFGTASNDFENNELLRQKAQELGCYIILKGAHSAIVTPEGECYFNSTGNPGMATAGSGDVLTGLLTGLLAQGYTPFEAARLGVYLHGLAGDIAAASLQEEALLASDLVEHLGRAFLQLKSVVA